MDPAGVDTCSRGVVIIGSVNAVSGVIVILMVAKLLISRKYRNETKQNKSNNKNDNKLLFDNRVILVLFLSLKLLYIESKQAHSIYAVKTVEDKIE